MVTLGLFGVVQLLWVGFSLGDVIGAAAGSGTSWLYLLAVTVPHSILELPGFALIAAAEIDMGVMIVRKVRLDTLGMDTNALTAIIHRIALGVGMISVGALVEVYVTGYLFQLLQ